MKTLDMTDRKREEPSKPLGEDGMEVTPMRTFQSIGWIRSMSIIQRFLLVTVGVRNLKYPSREVLVVGKASITLATEHLGIEAGVVHG